MNNIFLRFFFAHSETPQPPVLPKPTDMDVGYLIPYSPEFRPLLAFQTAPFAIDRSQPPSILFGLPPELWIHHIATFLSQGSLAKLRLVNRWFHDRVAIHPLWKQWINSNDIAGQLATYRQLNWPAPTWFGVHTDNEIDEEIMRSFSRDVRELYVSVHADLAIDIPFFGKPAGHAGHADHSVVPCVQKGNRVAPRPLS